MNLNFHVSLTFDLILKLNWKHLLGFDVMEQTANINCD
jgi:hypothetical protein